MGTRYAFAYVLACHVDDHLKIGFSAEPLRRFETFHRRYYEVFDIDRAFLIETDRVSEARQVERDLMRGIDVHNAPCPANIRPMAGGDTEWYRGAYDLVSRTASEIATTSGYVFHTPLRSWLRAELMRRADGLFEWSATAMAAMNAQYIDRRDDLEAEAFRAALLDRIDAYKAVDLQIGDFVTEEFERWHATQSHSRGPR